MAYSGRKYETRKVRKKNKTIRILKIILSLIILGTLIYASVELSKSPRFRVQGVDVQGAVWLKEGEVADVLNERLSGKYFLGYPQDNFRLFKKENIVGELMLEFPEIKDVKIQISKTKEMIVSLEERKPIFIWCSLDENAAVFKNEDKPECAFVDEEGLLYRPASIGGGYTFIFGPSSAKLEIGDYLIEEDLYTKIKSFYAWLEENEFKVNRIVISDEEDFSFIIENSRTESEVLLARETNFNDAADNFSRAIGQGNIPVTPSEIVDTLLYVDLRFNDEVLYKLR